MLRDEFGPVAKDIERCQKAAAAAAARAKEAAKRKKQGEEDAAKAAKAAWAAAKDGKKAADEAVDRVAKGDGAMPAEPTGQPEETWASGASKKVCSSSAPTTAFSTICEYVSPKTEFASLLVRSSKSGLTVE